ncbi:MAG: DoxX family protein, partial [Proteobacteria bacterium]
GASAPRRQIARDFSEYRFGLLTKITGRTLIERISFRSSMEIQKVNSPKLIWAGRIISVLAALPFIAGAIFSLVSNDPQMSEGFVKFGWPAAMLTPIVCLELICGILYAIPQTAVLGAILLTGYLGGAIATHLRVGENNVALQVILGVLLWAGLYLRFPSLRGLMPS